jgi:hypothetical protein
MKSIESDLIAHILSYYPQLKSFSELVNPVHSYFEPQLKFGIYKLTLGIGTGIDRSSSVDISEYFSQTEWDGMESVDQHNWLDNYLLEWTEEYMDMRWELVMYE